MFADRSFISGFLPKLSQSSIHAAIFRQIVRKNVLAKIPKGNTGYGQYTFPVVPDTIAVEPTFVDFL